MSPPPPTVLLLDTALMLEPEDASQKAMGIALFTDIDLDACLDVVTSFAHDSSWA